MSGKRDRQYFGCNFNKFRQLSQFLPRIILTIRVTEKFYISFSGHGVIVVIVATVPCSWDPKKHTWKLSEALRSAVITVDWQRKNKTVFKSVNYAGYVGVLTAVKPVSFHRVTVPKICFIQLLSYSVKKDEILIFL